jgi:hypothetical protein
MCTLGEGGGVLVVGDPIGVDRLHEGIRQDPVGAALLPRYEPAEKLVDFSQVREWVGSHPSVETWQSYPHVGSVGTAGALRDLATSLGLDVVVEPSFSFSLATGMPTGSMTGYPVPAPDLGTAIGLAQGPTQVTHAGLERIALFDTGSLFMTEWDCVGGTPHQLHSPLDRSGHGTTNDYLIQQVNSKASVTTFRVFDANLSSAADAVAGVIVALWAASNFAQFDQFVMPWIAESTCASTLGASVGWVLTNYLRTSGQTLPRLVGALPNDANGTPTYPAIWPGAERVGSKDWQDNRNDCGQPARYVVFGGTGQRPLVHVGTTGMYGTSMATALVAGGLSLM